MTQPYTIHTPLADQTVRDLKAGDEVLLSGTVYAARDQAHRRLCALIEAGQPLPFGLTGQVIYYVGPTPARPGRVIGAAGPTTASRMDAFTPALLARGLKATIGKGIRGPEVQQAIVQYGAVHFAALGGGGALLSQYITANELVAWDDLGAEALRRLEFTDFPLTVAYDAFGGCVYR
ncbi:MAG TPA: TRZ/ATZ family protein [Phycisphaerales bacterium]|nr:TRZ/ATZ family protein [Phycisphaerales bacterium]